MFSILWTEPAEQDLEKILSYYLEQCGMRVAESMYVRIKDQVGTLVVFPERMRLGIVDGTRECVISRLPYIAVIKVSTDAVQVLNIIHTARRYP